MCVCVCVCPESVREGQHLRTEFVFAFVTVNIVPGVSGGFSSRLGTLCCVANVQGNLEGVIPLCGKIMYLL